MLLAVLAGSVHQRRGEIRVESDLSNKVSRENGNGATVFFRRQLTEWSTERDSQRDTVIIPTEPITLFASGQRSENACALELMPGQLVVIPAERHTTLPSSRQVEAFFAEAVKSTRKDVFAICGLNEIVRDDIIVTGNLEAVHPLLAIMRRIIYSGNARIPSCDEAVFRIILWELCNDYQGWDARHTHKNPNQFGKFYRRVSNFVDQNIELSISVADMADCAGLSRYHFIRTFKRMAGITPLQFVIQRRLQLAREMLIIGEGALAEVSYASGFSSQSHLCTMFKREYGMSPGAFRRSFRDATH